jgi:hypothetical protein
MELHQYNGYLGCNEQCGKLGFYVAGFAHQKLGVQTPLITCEYCMDFKCPSIAWITLHQHNGYWDAMNYCGKLGFYVASSTH